MAVLVLDELFDPAIVVEDTVLIVMAEIPRPNPPITGKELCVFFGTIPRRKTSPSKRESWKGINLEQLTCILSL